MNATEAKIREAISVSDEASRDLWRAMGSPGSFRGSYGKRGQIGFDFNIDHNRFGEIEMDRDGYVCVRVSRRSGESHAYGDIGRLDGCSKSLAAYLASGAS